MKRNLILVIALCLVLAALLGKEPALVWMAVPFLCYLGAGLLTAPGEVRLRAARTTNVIRSECNAPVEMTVTIINEGPAVPMLRVDERDEIRYRVAAGQAAVNTNLSKGEQVVLKYTLQAKRGLYRWETVRVTVSDPLGLFETRLALPAAAEVRVLPERLPVNRLRLRPRATIHAAGPNLSRLAGAGTDFYGVREYHNGDSMRWIHWRLSARHPAQFFSKEFEREEMADIGLILDGGAAGNIRKGEEMLFEYSVAATAALARSLIRAGNRVSLLVLGNRVLRVFPGTGKAQLVHLLDQLAGCEPGDKATLDTMKYLPVRLFPSHSQIIIVSPLRTGDQTAIGRLRADGYQVLVISPNPVRFTDPETGRSLAARAALLERAALLWRVREMGVQVVDWTVSQPLGTEMRGHGY